MNSTKNMSEWRVTAAFGSLVLCQSVLASGYPACVNSQITLPGENGPELWSCVASPFPVDTALSHDARGSGTKISIASDESTAVADDIAVERRTEASSDAMKSEIERVLENPVDHGFVKRKHVAVGLQYSTNRKDQGLRESRDRSVVVPLSAGIDLTDRTRMTVTVPLINKAAELVGNSDVFNSDAFGVGDVSVNATSRLLTETQTRPGLAVSIGIGAPTGKNENPSVSDKLSLGSGFWSLSAGATVSKRFDPATLFGSIRYQHVFADEQFGHEVEPGSSLEYSYGLGFSLNSALSVSGHIAGAIHRNATVDGVVIEGSNSEPLEVVASSSLQLNRNTSLESNLGFGLNKDANDARIGLTLTKGF